MTCAPLDDVKGHAESERSALGPLDLPMMQHRLPSFARPIRSWITAFAVSACVVAGPLWAQDQMVVTLQDDGTQFVGTVVQSNSETYRIKSEATGLTRNYDRATTNVQSRRSFAAAQLKKLEALEATEGEKRDERYDIALTLFQAGLYHESKPVLEGLATEFPDDVSINRLRGVVDAQVRQIDARKRRETAESQPPTPGAPDAATTTDTPRYTGEVRGELVYLDEDAMNLITIYELPQDLAAAEPDIRIKSSVIAKVMKEYADEPAVPKGRAAQRAMMRAPGWRQLQMLFELEAREYYPEVRVRQEPASLETWRRRIHPDYVERYFYRHFGSGQLPIYLFNRSGSSKEEAYTNFYMLAGYQYQGQAMIDRTTPRDSLLLQWGLPHRCPLPRPGSARLAALLHRH